MGFEALQFAEPNAHVTAAITAHRSFSYYSRFQMLTLTLNPSLRSLPKVKSDRVFFKLNGKRAHGHSSRLFY